MRDPFRRVRIALVAVGLVYVAGTIGFLTLGYGLLDALYQTAATISTLGFESRHGLSAADKGFLIGLIIIGVGTTLYAFSSVLELLVDGHVRALAGRRRMERDIARMTAHVIVCGCGRVGSEVSRFLSQSGRDVVVIDRDPSRLEGVTHPAILGDVADDETLRAAGIERAATLVAALDTDADNLYATVAAKSLNPSVTVVARARNVSSEIKLVRAGADRVVNPQRLGGDRMASFVLQPHVVDFVDVVMHDGGLEFRLAQCAVTPGSALSGRSLRSSGLHEATGALVLAIRRPDGSFTTDPSPEEVFTDGDVLISVGTSEQVAALAELAARAAS